MCTDLQKKIYNAHLSVSRRAKNLPFKLRQEFSKINDTTALCLQKLEIFFTKHKEVNINEFFLAPFKIYPEGQTFPLKFFTTQKAITVYKIYKESQKSVDQPQ
jgi:hypothetical protein